MQLSPSVAKTTKRIPFVGVGPNIWLARQHQVQMYEGLAYNSIIRPSLHFQLKEKAVFGDILITNILRREERT